MGKLAKEQNIWRNLEKKNMQKRDSNPQPTKTEHFGNIGPNSAGEPVFGLPKATVHLYWPLRACSLPLTSFHVGFGFTRSCVLNWSFGQAVGTLEIDGQHHPSDKYTYQLLPCACTLIVRLSVSFRLSCLKPFTMHTRSRSSATSTKYFQGIFKTFPVYSARSNFQVGLVFVDLACSNCSLGQAVGTLGIARQHHPSDKYTYQLPACACTLILRLSVSFRLSCLKRF